MRGVGAGPRTSILSVAQRPLLVTAPGKAKLASLPVEAMEARLRGLTDLPRLTSRSHRSMDATMLSVRATTDLCEVLVADLIALAAQLSWLTSL
ncbi:hypothetical protein OG205_16490 [Lentzea sp. NBC_00516]|uniref:hypothetical protein n=1 Tax=Lentzea sp. NBC_00516 TaxID=2903582 RepID=UPI002E7FE619|nr:hypothetical protein [Lentzea sp. NBC_00516]WUD28533.1 hypothetical protein OG205_16490 [Lentzea sp. NBC_00516]